MWKNIFTAPMDPVVIAKGAEKDLEKELYD